MSTRSNQANNRPGISKNKNAHGRKSSKRVTGNRWFAANCGFRLLKRSELSSPLRFLKRLGCKVARALHMGKRPSPRVSSSSGISRTFVASTDTHRTEAIEACIEFINSSSSLPRSNSVSANRS